MSVKPPLTNHEWEGQFLAQLVLEKVIAQEECEPNRF